MTIDVSELMSDPDLGGTTFTRRVPTTTFANGISKATYTDTTMAGIVQPAATADAQLLPDGVRLSDVQAFFTAGAISPGDGKDTAPDLLVDDEGITYQVLHVQSYGKHGMGGLTLPKGGMGAVAAALEKAARAAGVEIRTNTPVDHILLEQEIATGVVLRGGEEVRAPIVASSADPQTTLLKLVQPGNLDTEFMKRIRHLRMNGCVAKVHLALDGLPDAWKSHAGRMVLAPKTDYVERAFDCAKYGRVADKPALEIVIPTLSDPSLAPSGKHVASILFQYAPYKLRETSQDEARRQVLERTIDTLDVLAPGLRTRVTGSEVLTPHDLETQFGLAGGQWHQGEVTLDQMFFLRPAGQYQQYRMPIPGLWLCGAGAHPGGNVSGAAGMNAAREILKSLKQRRAA